MTAANLSTPKPKKTSTQKSETFSARVDYVAKALKRGSWGPAFDACFSHADSVEVAAAIIQRASKNDELKEGLLKAFDVTSWNDIPWVSITRDYEGMSARQISKMAEDRRSKSDAQCKKLYQNPALVMTDTAETPRGK